VIRVALTLTGLPIIVKPTLDDGAAFLFRDPGEHELQPQTK
jgi:hypothetical protein